MTEHVVFIPRNYEMSPQLETLLRGRDLRNGMEVILETAEFRQDIADMNRQADWIEKYKDDKRVELSILSSYQSLLNISNERALRWNRWVIISDLEMGDKQVSFVGTYDDGTKKFFSITKDYAWYVKKSSIEVAEKLKDHNCITNGCWVNQYKPDFD